MVSDAFICIIGGNRAEEILFNNRYQPSPTSAHIPGSKELIGKVLGEGDFSFALYESNESWQEGRWLQAAENDADGRFCFNSISYDTPGAYYYLVKEVGGGQSVDGVTYDDTIYRVTVNVTDNGTGALEADLKITTGQGEAVEEISFENTFVEPPPETGDTGISLWLTLLAISCGGIVTMTTFNKKKTEDENEFTTQADGIV